MSKSLSRAGTVMSSNQAKYATFNGQVVLVSKHKQLKTVSFSDSSLELLHLVGDSMRN